MENWEVKVLELLEKYPEPKDMDTTDVTKLILEAMNLVFEATKKECADKAEVEQHDRISIFVDKMIQDEDSLYKYYANKESILNINKPNL